MEDFLWGKNNATICVLTSLYDMDIDGLRRWWNNSRTWSHSWRSWRRSWRSRWLNSNAWRGNFQQPKHGRLKGGGRKLGDNEERWTRFVMAIPNADACGCFAHWELPLKSTEEKRAEEAETKNQELEVQIFFIAVQRAPPNPHVFWRFQFLKWSFYVWFPYE